MGKISVHITLDEKLVKELHRIRGIIPLSTFLDDLLWKSVMGSKYERNK